MLAKILLTATVTIGAVTGAAATASAAVPASASCIGYGSSVLGPLGLRDDVAHNPDTFPPGADTSSHAELHGNTFDACFAG